MAKRVNRSPAQEPERINTHHNLTQKETHLGKEAFLDEIPAAYKDIDQVMADAGDLVSVRHALPQIVNVKGDQHALRCLEQGINH